MIKLELLPQWAREAGFDVVHDAEDGQLVGIYGSEATSDVNDMAELLQKLVAIVAEECAKLCDAQADRDDNAAAGLALSIRERFKL